MHIGPASPDNEAIRELRDSSKRLEKLTEELSKSSRGLEQYTIILIYLTILLLIITFIALPPEFPLWAKAITLLIILAITLSLLLKKK